MCAQLFLPLSHRLGYILTDPVSWGHPSWEPLSMVISLCRDQTVFFWVACLQGLILSQVSWFIFGKQRKDLPVCSFSLLWMHFLQFPAKAMTIRIPNVCLSSVIHFLSSKHGKVHNLVLTQIQMAWLSETTETSCSSFAGTCNWDSKELKCSQRWCHCWNAKENVLYNGFVPFQTLMGPVDTRGRKLRYLTCLHNTLGVIQQ